MTGVVFPLAQSEHHPPGDRGRILYVIGSLAIGGAERHLVAVASGLRRKGWQTEVFALSPQGPLLDILTLASVPVKGVRLPGWMGAVFGVRFGSWLRSILSVVVIARDLWRHPGTVVHFFLPAAYILGGLAAWLVKAHPRIMSRRSLNRYQRKYPLYRKIEHFLHSRMDVLVGNSQAVVRELQAETEERTPVRLIYNGIETATVNVEGKERARSKLGLDASPLVMVIVANLIPYKGHEDLIRALGSVKQRLPAGWKLLCVGRDDGIGPSLRQLAEGLGIGDNVFWLGARLDVPDCLMAADIGVLASHEEGFSNAVLEAMMAGLPLVVTDVGGNSEAVEEGITGYVVPARDPGALGAAIVKLATNPQRTEMGAHGRARVIREFSMEACLGAYEALYRDVQSKVFGK